MKSIIATSLLAAAALCVSMQPAAAASYEEYHCKCLPPKDESCSCSFSHTLGALATKEFRGYCDKLDDDHDFPGISVSNRDKNTTCTIPLGIMPRFNSHQYGSISCTNWSLFSKDSVSIKVVCTNKYPTGGVI